MINWEINAIDFANKIVESQVSELNDLFLFIYSNCIPIKNVSCDGIDPPWMTNWKRNVIEMNWVFVYEVNGCGFESSCCHLMLIKNILGQVWDITIATARIWFVIVKLSIMAKLAAKLVNLSTILKTFANERKVPVTPPLLINNKFVSKFKTKANYFNRCFNQKCTSISTDRSIPFYVNRASTETVTTINFDEQLISKIIVALNPDKTHDSIPKFFSMIFRSSLKPFYFPTSWKKANIAPVQREGNKQILNNYWPAFILPNCSKLFEKIIVDTIFQYMMENKLLNSNQLGFMPRDSCIHQLISINRDTYASFDGNPSLEVRSVFFIYI